MTSYRPNRRAILGAAGAGAALALLAGRSGGAVTMAETGQLPWAKHFFNLFTNSDGVAQMREIELPRPGTEPPHYLLRHQAARITVRAHEPNFMFDWHVANQPNILIPLFGTLVVELRDGSRYEFRHGDILFAEDCAGSGHRSGAGSDGQFGVSVQLDQALCPAPGESILDQVLRV